MLETAIEIIEENNYYPFGLKHEGYNTLAGNPSYNYGYNGKELQTESGMYDYGARMYMSDIGRWGVIDPLAETTRRFSPYNYALNNPVSFIDPDGRKAYAPDTWSWNISSGGAASYYLAGGKGATGMSMDEWSGNVPTIFTPSAGGGGLGLTANTTKSVRQLHNYFQINGVSGSSIDYLFDNYSEGYVAWWTGGAAGNANTSQEMIAHILNLNRSDVPEIRQSYYNFNPYKPDNTPDWYGFGGRANWGIGAAAVGLNKFSGDARVTTTGSSIKLYRPNANGNVFIRNAYTKTTAISKIGTGIGYGSFGLGLTMDVIGVYNYYNNPDSSNKVHPAKAGLNTAMSAYGLTGAGTIPALLYFGVDAFYPGGWEAYGNDYQSIQSDNAAIMPGFITAPYGSQKF